MLFYYHPVLLICQIYLQTPNQTNFSRIFISIVEYLNLMKYCVHSTFKLLNLLQNWNYELSRYS